MSDFFQSEIPGTMPEDRMEVQQQPQREFKFIGSLRAIPGHKLFSYNTRTGEIKEAVMEYEVRIDARTLKPVRTMKIAVEKDCIYRQSLNKRNLVRHLIREFAKKQ